MLASQLIASITRADKNGTHVMPPTARTLSPLRSRRKTEEVDLAREIEKLRKQNQTLRREVRDLRLLKEAAYRDPVTGLRNRRYFEERLAEEMGRLSRNPEREGALLLVDVDDFKGINDQHGHAAGDQVLREVAGLLEQTLRLEDVCCRFGGDEFAVILPETPEAGVERVLCRVQDAVSARNVGAGLAVHLAVGVSLWPVAGCDAESLLGAADRNMYLRKREGKRARTPFPSPPRLTLVE